MMEAAYLQASDLVVGYDGKAVLGKINLEVRRGEILTLIGPNGAGKSTILKTIIHQLKSIAGTVVLDGHSMDTLSEREIAKKLSVVMTERLRPELMTCRDVVATGRYPYTGRFGILSAEDEAIVDACMARVSAGELAGRPFDKISDGQRQRVLLARALCQEPEIIVLDEPTSFLDVRHKLELLHILKTLVRERNVAVIMSLHELDLAQRVSDRLVCVSPRGIEVQGTPEEIFRPGQMEALYGIDNGSFYPPYASVELPKAAGSPRVFVIGGGGSGIETYRRLQRQGIPFAAGVIPENDLDYPVAKALANELVSIPAFGIVDDEAIARARAVIARCGEVICTLPAFGQSNRKLELLWDEYK